MAYQSSSAQRKNVIFDYSDDDDIVTSGGVSIKPLLYLNAFVHFIFSLDRVYALLNYSETKF